jgi:4-hydroxy-3-methylbut-2-enyl diphosphate reductase
MEIIRAENAGFCFGVDRAMKNVYKNIDSKPLYTYGPIIHNKQVVDELTLKGVKVVNSLEELDTVDIGTIIIRSHGVSKAEFDAISNKGFSIIDATCPYVKKIHKIVYEYSQKGFSIIIIGDKEHPEVKGIKGHCVGTVFIINEVDEAKSLNLERDNEYCIVSQTTFNVKKNKEIVKELQKKEIHVIINKTICSATGKRQDEALELSKKVTKMIVIGGKHSSNTKKLYTICKQQCENTYHIECIEDLELNVFNDSDIIGVTAGASTPNHIIEEVILNVAGSKF